MISPFIIVNDFFTRSLTLAYFQTICTYKASTSLVFSSPDLKTRTQLLPCHPLPKSRPRWRGLVAKPSPTPYPPQWMLISRQKALPLLTSPPLAIRRHRILSILAQLNAILADRRLTPRTTRNPASAATITMTSHNLFTTIKMCAISLFVTRETIVLLDPFASIQSITSVSRPYSFSLPLNKID